MQKRKRFIAREEKFRCENCGREVGSIERGSYRSHCPYCLYTKHVDLEVPGDRKNPCKGLMKPVSVEMQGGSPVLIHKCVQCGETVRNKAAEDDDADLLVDLSTVPHKKK